ncbi:RRQRL motif-containing zinc-binding protein [Streptomyces sp. NPDC002547]
MTARNRRRRRATQPRTPLGLPEYDFGCAPELLTRRQLRAKELRPGGQPPVAVLRCRRCTLHPMRACTHHALLYREDLAKPKLAMTLAKERALDRAMEARQRCPLCLRRYFFCLPLRTLGSCAPCHDGIPADPSTYLHEATHGLAA